MKITYDLLTQLISKKILLCLRELKFTPVTIASFNLKASSKEILNLYPHAAWHQLISDTRFDLPEHAVDMLILNLNLRLLKDAKRILANDNVIVIAALDRISKASMARLIPNVAQLIDHDVQSKLEDLGVLYVMNHKWPLFLIKRTHEFINCEIYITFTDQNVFKLNDKLFSVENEGLNEFVTIDESGEIDERELEMEEKELEEQEEEDDAEEHEEQEEDDESEGERELEEKEDVVEGYEKESEEDDKEEKEEEKEEKEEEKEEKEDNETENEVEHEEEKDERQEEFENEHKDELEEEPVEDHEKEEDDDEDEKEEDDELEEGHEEHAEHEEEPLEVEKEELNEEDHEHELEEHETTHHEHAEEHPHEQNHLQAEIEKNKITLDLHKKAMQEHLESTKLMLNQLTAALSPVVKKQMLNQVAQQTKKYENMLASYHDLHAKHDELLSEFLTDHEKALAKEVSLHHQELIDTHQEVLAQHEEQIEKHDEFLEKLKTMQLNAE